MASSSRPPTSRWARSRPDREPWPLTAPLRYARSRWRRSLQVRVVASTVVLSVVVVLLVGGFLLSRITDGLLQAKTDAALLEASTGAAGAQSRFDTAERTDSSSLIQLVDSLVSGLASGGGQAGLNEVVLLRSPAGPSVSVALDRASNEVEASSIPSRLRRAVEAQQRQQWTRAPMRYTDGRPPVPGLVVGTPVRVPGAGSYELYLLFPLTNEERTIGLVRSTLAVAGLALVVLVALVAWVVTHLVVRPVRIAAHVSERIAAGRLEERMPHKGEDDLARLAASFNRMASALQQQIRRLEDLSRVQRRFVSDVSHELRTPLTTVRMAADVIYEARPGLDPVTGRSAELLQTQLDRFESLLADLLEVSRFDAGAAVLDAEPVDLRDLCARVIDAAEPLAERRGSTLRLIAPGRACVAEVDPRRIERVLRNLVVNAVEHGEGYDIEVTVAADDDAVAVAVRDHGVGLRPGESALVFHRFWRGDPARARTTGGTGLGLSIAMEDSRLHGGWLQAWGEPGSGSQFRLTLPRRPAVELDHSPLPLEPPDSRRRLGLDLVAPDAAGEPAPTAAGPEAALAARRPSPPSTTAPTWISASLPTPVVTGRDGGEQS